MENDNIANNVIEVSKFYNSSCPVKDKIYSQIHEENRPIVLKKALNKAVSSIGKKTTDEICSDFKEHLAYSYKASWFSYAFVKDSQVEADTVILKRFLEWLGHPTILESNIYVSVRTNTSILKTKVDLVVSKADGSTYAFICHFKKADKSENGKSVHTKVQSDLYAMTAKASLEEIYPGIKICLVYLINPKDANGNTVSFVVDNTKSSNAFFVDFNNYYEDGSFDKEGLISEIDNILSVPVQPDCFNCSQKELCSVKNIKNTQVKNSATFAKESTFLLPSYTSTQKEVIEHVNGAMMVVAGPGSGKTATLVGRIKSLIDKGIEPEFILAITFTNTAADELLKRCKSFCKQSSMPVIMTLNSLGYRLLQRNKEIIGRECVLLNQRKRLELIDTLLENEEQLQGFSYAVRTGRTGLLSTVDRKLNQLDELGSEKFFEKNKDIGDDFKRFSQHFKNACSSHGYISYDEQISLAISFLKQSPEALKAYTSLYKYIMVDEYQDINASQNEFINLLAQHGNLVCVGDDDQSIYGFRGASNKYMLNFKKEHPTSKLVVLRENFRSREGLVKTSQSFITGNKDRIQKDVCATRKGGNEPVILYDKSVEKIAEIINSLVKKGYSYSDIAVLAGKNSTLQSIAEKAVFPCVLDKAYLRENPYFKIIWASLKIILSEDEVEKYKYFLNMLIADDAKVNILVDEAKSLYVQGANASKYIDTLFEHMNISISDVAFALSDIIETEHINNLPELLSFMDYMIDFEDDTRLSPDTSSSVILITNHESKGMEWKVVIMVDDFSDKEKTEETNRLYYVAMTRAKDELFVLCDNKTLLQPA